MLVILAGVVLTPTRYGSASTALLRPTLMTFPPVVVGFFTLGALYGPAPWPAAAGRSGDIEDLGKPRRRRCDPDVAHRRQSSSHRRATAGIGADRRRRHRPGRSPAVTFRRDHRPARSPAQYWIWALSAVAGGAGSSASHEGPSVLRVLSGHPTCSYSVCRLGTRPAIPAARRSATGRWVADAELPSSVEGRIEVFFERHLGVAVATLSLHRRRRGAVAPSALIEVLDPIGVEPQADVARPGRPPGAQAEFTRRRMSASQTPAPRRPRIRRASAEADRLVPSHRRPHVAHPEHRVALLHRSRRVGRSASESSGAGCARPLPPRRPPSAAALASRSPRSIATASGVRPLSSVASRSAPSSMSSSSIGVVGLRRPGTPARRAERTLRAEASAHFRTASGGATGNPGPLRRASGQDSRSPSAIAEKM